LVITVISPIPEPTEPGERLQVSSPGLFLPAQPIPELAEELSNHVFNTLKPVLDTFKARNIADQALRVLIGPNSLLSAFNDQVRTLREDGQNDALRAYVDETIPGLTHA